MVLYFCNINGFKNEVKNLDEAKGEIITNYQNYLESLWKIELEQKYPSKVYKDILYKIIN